MTHHLVKQLRFARSEFSRCLTGVTEEDGMVRLGKMNTIGWSVGHLANQEHQYWVIAGQGIVLFPGLNSLVGYGSMPNKPSLKEMLESWDVVKVTADKYLDPLSETELKTHFIHKDGFPYSENVGTMVLRNIYHYWFHIGEIHAIRQQLGHTDLPQFVGGFNENAYVGH